MDIFVGVAGKLNKNIVKVSLNVSVLFLLINC